MLRVEKEEAELGEKKKWVDEEKGERRCGGFI